MKKIILTTLMLRLFLYSGFCQQPTQSDINKMMKDAQSMLAKFKQQAKDTSSFKKTAKKYLPVQPASAVVIIPLKQPLQIPTTAQAKDHLLWYKGKKMNDSMIVTTKGLLVLYKKKQDKVIAQPLEKEDSFRILVKNLSRTTKMTNDYVVKELAKKNSFMNYPLVQMAVDEFKMIDDRMNDIVKNTIDLPKVNFTVPQKSKGSDGESDLETMEDLNQMHQQLRQLLANKPSLNFDPPPKKDFSLTYLCDTNARKRYIEDLKKWDEAFLGYEKELVSKDLQIERSIQLLGMNPDADALLRADLDEGLNVAFSRWDEKIKLLKAEYSKDVFRQECVVSAILTNEREKQLMGRSSEVTLLDIDFFFGPEFENYINEQIGKKNWDVILNISLFLGRERQAQLLGNSEAGEGLNKLLQRVLKLNRFALTADIDFNVQYTDADGELAIKANGKLETTDKVYVSMYVNRSGCKWTLQLYTPDFANAKETDYYIPMKVTGGIKSIKEDKEWKDYSYSGPTDMLLHFPVFSMDFSAGSEQDSATLEPLRYLPGADVTNNIMKAYKADLLGFMNHVFIVIADQAGKVTNMLDVANAMVGKFANVTAPPASDAPLEDYKNRYLLMQQKQESEQQMAGASFKPRTIILFNAANNTTVLIDQTVDTKHKEEGVELTKGIIKIKVVHDPVEN
jgi:outer membrane lipoprotein-sorting protein